MGVPLSFTVRGLNKLLSFLVGRAKIKGPSGEPFRVTVSMGENKKGFARVPSFSLPPEGEDQLLAYYRLG